MKLTEFKKLIREEIRKVISEGPSNPGAGSKLSVSSITAGNYVIMDLAINDQQGKWTDLLLSNLKSKPIVKFSVKEGELDSGYKGLFVDLILQGNVSYKLFFDNDEFSSDIPTIKSMATKPNAAKLTKIIKSWM
jgi:hypothetical protein